MDIVIVKVGAALTLFLVPAALVAINLIRQLITYENRWRTFKKQQDFEQVFGFEVPLRGYCCHTPWVAMTLELIEERQQGVDAKLKGLAGAFARADLAERIARTAAKKARSHLEKKAYMQRVAEARQYVGDFKEMFWAAHGLAKSAGFAVRGSYKDYLDDELRAKVEAKGPRL